MNRPASAGDAHRWESSRLSKLKRAAYTGVAETRKVKHPGLGLSSGTFTRKAIAARARRKRNPPPTPTTLDGSGPVDGILRCPYCGEEFWRGDRLPGDWRQCFNRCSGWFRQPVRGEQPRAEDAAGRRGERVTSRYGNEMKLA